MYIHQKKLIITCGKFFQVLYEESNATELFKYLEVEINACENLQRRFNGTN